jgi:hypothetical protein
MGDLLAMLIGAAIATLWHEAGHAALALVLTRARVRLVVGLGPTVHLPLGRLSLGLAPLPFGGYCEHEDTGRRGDRALIAAAGPVASTFLAALAWYLSRGPAAASSALVLLFSWVAVSSAFCALLTALPLRYPPGLGPGMGDSDGLTVLRALFPASPLVLKAPRAERRPERPLRLPFLIVLVALIFLAFALDFWLGAVVTVLFGSAYRGERAAG